MILQFILAASISLSNQLPPAVGSISGVVVNASQGGSPVSGAGVVLRVKLEGQFVTAAEGTADEQGRFEFSDIPADLEYIYLPGANLAGVHYPGPRIRLSAQRPHARLKLPVHDPVSQPNPLIVRRHEITLQPKTDALRVTETLLIDNPTSRTYVGQPAQEGSRAATLQLSIPSDFRRTTFHKEFYGRQFVLIEGRLVTDVPWTPGRRKLAFTYVLPNSDHHRVWQRPLDLPCDEMRIIVHTQDPNEVTCNLPRTSTTETGTVTFESSGEALPAGHVIRLEIGRLPVSLSAYGRWLALAVLVVLIGLATLIGCRRTKRSLQAGDSRSGDGRKPHRSRRAVSAKS